MIAPRNARQTRRRSALNHAKTRGFLAYCAWLVAALQVVTALHFALVPHAFSAQLTSFVHVHARAEQRAEASRASTSRTKSVRQGDASCAADSCPIGFAGHTLLELARFEVGTSLPALLPSSAPRLSSHVPARARLLLSAPKTSPPV